MVYNRLYTILFRTHLHHHLIRGIPARLPAPLGQCAIRVVQHELLVGQILLLEMVLLMYLSHSVVVGADLRVNLILELPRRVKGPETTANCVVPPGNKD